MHTLEIFFAIFIRTFALVNFLPIFNIQSFSFRAKGVFVFLISIILHSAQVPRSVLYQPFLKIIFLEVLVGSLLGCLIKLYFEVVNIASSLITMQYGLPSNYSVNIHSKEQGAVLYNFFFFCLVLCAFACNVHHIFLKGLVNSYNIFPIGGMDIFLADWIKLLSNTFSQVFKVSLQLASACLLVNFLIVAGSCILSKIVPMIQVFFLLSPLKLPIALLLLSVSLPSFFKKLIDFFEGLNSFTT